MWPINIIGFMDSIRGKKGSMKHYKNKLLHFKEQEAETHIDIGVIYLEDENPEKALKHFYEALKMYKNLHSIEGEAFVHNLLGDLYISMRNPSKAIMHYQDSFKLYASMKSPLKNELFSKIKDTEKAEEVIEILKNKEE
ncbi:tetratricopeptide repeat protein [Methanobacterium alcaliphilum]|uniref:tetratricopeptide repeat protein n=1 Tax=Methanobacterium alcaliphilum TaxID=392018 RepID=UPI00200A0D8B|nr:tetratricopeptide repeat protein [Methanobacterium alcaliphilum]MCK9151621.1 tetratricopeptide repeat protein [Methanobacterium alcaliphilum]